MNTPKRIRLPVKAIQSIEDCQKLAEWTTRMVAQGKITPGAADAMLRGVREWRQSQLLGIEVARRKALEKRIAELEASKHP